MAYDIGFLGGGQLARMSIQAAQRLGLTCLSLDPAIDSPASQVADSMVGPLDDPNRIADVFRSCSRVTLENEFIDATAIREGLQLAVADESVLLPGLDCLATIQDKLLQKQAIALAGVPSPRAWEIGGIVHQPPSASHPDKGGDCEPVVLKARFGGYDGKGTRYARDLEEMEEHRYLWGPGGWMAEEMVDFRRELAVMVFRSPNQTGCFPTMETVQTNHVCDLVFPGGADASEIAVSAVEAVGGYGLFGVELFELQDGSFKVNEIAPRPHNSGHYTLDWGGVSQFEQHVRLVMGWPLDKPRGLDVCMANLLGQHGAGDHRAGLAPALSEPSIHLHWYGKVESRPGRKMGHINAVGKDCVKRAKSARERFYGAWVG